MRIGVLFALSIAVHAKSTNEDFGIQTPPRNRAPLSALA
jgi:hypothetical protein